jgi:hypothetical protein
MEINDLIYPNRFTELHNNETIFYCKRDFIIEEYDRLSKLKHDVILIVGNSDYSFDKSLLNIKPSNVKHIFANNSLIYNDIVTPIPVGIENITESKREGHGVINNGVFEKLPYFLNPNIVQSSVNKIDKLYSNFNTSTNPSYRENIKNISINSNNIDFETGLNYSDFVSRVKSYTATLSPEGNGIECIRTFEVLYLEEIPICVGDLVNYNAIYESIYKHLPIVYLNDINDISNHSKIKSEINKIKDNPKDLLYFDFWKEKILNMSKKIL